MGLRLVEGVDLERYRRLAGREISGRRLSDLLENGMVEMIGNHRVRATHDGFFVLDAVVADLAA